MAQGIASRYHLLLTGLSALLIATAAGSIAGIYLGSATAVLALIPGLLVLLPASIGMRGNISGVFASRLSSSMHLGEFEVSFTEGSVLGDNLRASLIISVLTAFFLGLAANVVGLVSGIEVIGALDLVLISLLSGMLSSIVILLFTILLSIASYRYGLDLDLIGAPAVTTAGDIVTIPVLVASAVLVMLLPPELRDLLALAAVASVAVTLVYTLRTSESVRRMVTERTVLLLPLSFLGIMAGATYEAGLEELVAFAAFLILIPPYMGGLGSIGGILASRLATGMHMGTIPPLLLPGRETAHHFIITYFYTLILLPLMAVIAHAAAVLLGLATPGLVAMVAISLLAGLLIVTLMNGMAYVTASLSFRFGLDPDNYGIPVITSLIDFIGAAVLVATIGILL
ncbi:magnesium transporter MgtE [Methanoculleus taiwanensis]|uniref:Magnesium transporter MgtE n=1 Tax=Methanoculleus taiwanensis TaxID=1550565 RepID=A0A498H0M5_9EURY|nr:magnesium transporter [Methanoculleus taiwanensis]RXE56168.1 magnesium transporter MgtE [Methanoculleus taiwanensis]